LMLCFGGLYRLTTAMLYRLVLIFIAVAWMSSASILTSSLEQFWNRLKILNTDKLMRY
jgi:hypothetical protein